MSAIARPGRNGWVGVKTPVALPGQRIGLLGGTFNPPHQGHVQVSQIALRRLGLDRLWWLVTPGNPLKSNGGLPPLADRIATCRRLMREPRVVVTGFEAALGSPFTASTVEFLVCRYPGTAFVWVMGADNLASFHRWRRWQDIARLVPVAVVDRPGWRLKALASPAARTLWRSRLPEDRASLLPLATPPAWTLLTGPLSPQSSTAIRARNRA